ncbi:unnamed protein product [Penicillium salamii]|uniref:CheY-like superfamily n=1 Tax=Penicillium salamii TaxID=1612424 RepID=A0A9W4JPT9_9EURO|nr:unnamed protein product [Penicillium salamii]
MGQPDEQERVRELSRFDPSPPQSRSSLTYPDRYYCTFDQHGLPEDSIDSVRLSSDTTLTALTQLGVYRFGCNRSFVSIIDGGNQHVISEATASISLRDAENHRPDDGIFLGVRTLDLEWGVCPHAIRLFTGQDESHIQDTENVTANRTRNIIRDFTKEDFYKDRSYVLGWPHFRFYAEVPLYSPSGYVLGSYCVVDDKPRSGFGDEEVSALREIADAITNHLENSRVVQYHRRSENLVKGLTNFVKSGSKFDPTGHSTQNQLETSTKNINSDSLEPSVNLGDVGESIASLSAKDRGVYSSLDQRSSPSLNAREASVFSGTGRSRSKSTLPSSLSRTSSDRTDPVSSMDGPSELAVTEDVPITERIAAIFSRASILLKESLDLDGVVFLDAHRNDPQFEQSGQNEGWEAVPQFVDPGFPLTPRASLPKDAGKYCGFLGQPPNCWTANVSTALNCRIMVTEDLLHSLITHFPEGHVFDLESSDESPIADDDTTPFAPASEPIQSITDRLSQQLPDSRFVLFYPLWDWSKSRWLAGTLVWINGCHRPLGTEELHYFKAFGDSIISEVSRLHWTASENSKFDFVTSISHELRSPLHGILASAELLNDFSLQSAQHDIVKMISTSGITLLDTIDHLLDYCKINNLGTAHDLDKKKNKSGTMSLVSEFNLDHLVEDVAMILHTGRSPVEPTTLSKQNSPAVSAQSPQERNPELSLVINIEQSRSWKIRSVAGAWRRIVMNLLGNSLKWTQDGLIELSLSEVIDQATDSALIHLRVTDTGRGIAPEFLKNSAFTPFSQEDALSEGVGLGLSIVHKLVAFLGGHINMRSEFSVGTQVDVYIPSPQCENPVPTTADIAEDAIETDSNEFTAGLIGFNSYPDLAETPTGIMSPDAKRKLAIQNALAGVLMSQMACRISLAESIEKGLGDIAIIEEARFKDTWDGTKVPSTLGSRFKVFIVLGSTSSTLGDTSLPSNVVFIQQPFGPKRICQAAAKAKDLLASQPEDEYFRATDLDVPPAGPEGLSSQLKAIAIPETPVALVPETPIEVVCPNPPGDVDSEAKDQMHVLIVDDNDINVQILATFMRKLGYSYDTASNGLIALEKVESSCRRFDLILMDLSMPVMDGLVSTSKIRQHEKDNAQTPSCIMAVTGVASDTMRQAARTAGVNDYLVKPLSLRKLKKLISVLF